MSTSGGGHHFSALDVSIIHYTTLHVCMYIHVCTCMYVHVYIYVQSYAFVHVCTCSYSKAGVIYVEYSEWSIAALLCTGLHMKFY